MFYVFVIAQYVIQIKNGTIKDANVNAKVILLTTKDYNWNPSTCICENSKYLKSNSVTACDEIISIMDIASAKRANITSTASINCNSTKVTDCYILLTVFLAILLLFIIIIFCFHYTK